MGLLQGFSDITSAPKDAHETTRALESMVLKQILAASGAFKGTDAAGSSLHSDLFAEALADAVSRSGGLGIAAELERSLGPQAAPSGHDADPKTRIAQRNEMPLTPEDSQWASPLGKELSVTSDFGNRVDPLKGGIAEHDGIDLAAAEGAPVHAVASGTVHRVGPRGGYGNAVEIDHGNGVSTLYAHASELLVNEGDRVEQGQTVMKAGHTGRATGSHLHFEIREAGKAVNPGRVLKMYGNRDDM